MLQEHLFILIVLPVANVVERRLDVFHDKGPIELAEIPAAVYQVPQVVAKGLNFILQLFHKEYLIIILRHFNLIVEQLSDLFAWHVAFAIKYFLTYQLVIEEGIVLAHHGDDGAAVGIRFLGVEGSQGLGYAQGVHY